MINNYEFFNDCVYIMSALKKFGAKDICVAGGAIRDTLLGKPVKDIDVFFTGELDLDDESELAKHYGLEWNTDDPIVDSTSYEDSPISVMKSTLSFKDIEYPVQLIQIHGTSLEDIVAQVDAFPCGLSKAILQEDGTLSLASDFLQNEYFKIVSYKPDSPMKYKNKLQQKYPEYVHE